MRKLLLVIIIFFFIHMLTIRVQIGDTPELITHEIAVTTIPSFVKEDLKCLVDTIYWEAGNQTPKGMSAVAKVVLNRAASGRYPSSICEVVYQPRQFTWVDVVPKHKRSKEVRDPVVWNVAIRALKGEFEDEINGWSNVLHYHATYIKKPVWAKKKRIAAIIGDHIFYEE